MRRIFSVLALAALGAAGGVAAGGGQNLYAVTHVDIAGTSGKLAEATSLIREFEADSRKDPGVLRFEVWQQEGHPNHFTIYEVWRTRQAFEAHLAAEHTRRFREKLQPVLGSPFRERLHHAL